MHLAVTTPVRRTISRRRSPPTPPATPRWVEQYTESLQNFYGTNDFAAADAAIGVDPVTGQYTLHSIEAGSGGARNYVRFTQSGPLGPGLENSPEGENSMSRIYLGIHWRMDQEDGQALGRAVADYVAANYFQAVPEPGTMVMALLGAMAIVALMRRKRSS